MKRKKQLLRTADMTDQLLRTHAIKKRKKYRKNGIKKNTNADRGEERGNL